MAKNNLIGGSIWDEYSKVVQDRMNNPKFMGELTEEDAKKANAKLIIADFGAESCGDAVRLLPDLAAAGRPDVVYLDPMYPERQKSAAVKKEMAYFHQLIGSAQNTDDAELLAAARDVATKRIVVKRPRLGALLAQCTPAYQYSGKSTRFDIYLPTRPSIGE